MSTAHRAEINRVNSQHSTGPKTAEEKKVGSLSALRHGLTGQMVVMSTEDLAAYERHVSSFTEEYRPEGATEAHLVQALADTSWRLNRVAVLETNLLTLTTVFASEAITAATQMAAAIGPQAKALSNLSMHSQRLSRQFERTVAQLRDLQQSRRAQEKEDLEDLVNIIEMHESTGKTYNPSVDGFAFSPAQINEAIRARTRERLVAEAFDHRYDSAAA